MFRRSLLMASGWALITLWTVSLTTFGQAPPGQPPPGLEAAAQRPERQPQANLRLNYAGTPGTLDLVLEDYAQKTGKTLLRAPNLPKVDIKLRSQGDLTLEEYLQAIESVLTMNGIALLPVGDKFLRVVPAKEARQQAMKIKGEVAEEGLEETDSLVSQMIPLTYIDLNEAKKAIDSLKHSFAQILSLERTNSLLVTDTAANINRLLQILRYIDQPVEAREEPNVLVVRHAKAADIKKTLEEIIAESQKEQEQSTVPKQKSSGSPGVVRSRSIPGVIRARPSKAAEETTMAELVEQAERGIIRGRVQIVADERTNILIIITRPENMAFFEKIVKVLDVETTPDVVVKVLRLEFAESETVATMLNELIGATSEEDEPKGTAPDGETPEDRGAALREYLAQQAQKSARERKSKVGELSKENIKILSDERTNSLIIMASKGDLATLEEIVDDMDMMLSQVLVEAVIMEVNLDDSIETGVDWIQRALIAYNEENDGTRSPVAAFAGGGGGGLAAPQDALGLTTSDSLGQPFSGLTYYLTFFDLNLDVVLQAVATDSRTRILSSPVILTTDNKDASIDVSTERYFYKGKKYVGGGDNPFYEDDVERQKVGITLTVTPRINQKKFVVMEIAQTIDNISGVQTINETDWPIVTTRKLEADVAVRSGETIVLGGLVQNQKVENESKIPLLGDLPVIGIPFRSSRTENTRQEVIVFLTPYVLDTPEDIASDASRRKKSIGIGDMWQRGWSASRLAAPPAPEEDGDRNRRLGGFFRDRAGALPQDMEDAPAEDPLQGLDAETRAFIQIQQRRWDGRLEAIDKRIEQELEDPENKNP